MVLPGQPLTGEDSQLFSQGVFFLCSGAFVLSKDDKSPQNMGKYHLHFMSKGLSLAQGPG